MARLRVAIFLDAFTTHLGRLRDHHVAVHEDVGDVLLDAGEDGRAHRDVRDEVAVHDVWVVSSLQRYVARVCVRKGRRFLPA